MSKIETVKHLDDSAPQLLIVRSVTQLQQAVKEMQSDLQSLPAAIATETAHSLQSVTQLQQSVIEMQADLQKVPVTVEQITAEHSTLIDEVTEEMSKAFSRQAARLETKVSEWQTWAASMQSSVNEINTTMAEARKLPGRITTAAGELAKETKAIKQARPSWTSRAATMLIAAALGATLALAGQSAFDELVPPSTDRQNAAWAEAVWKQATEQERELMKEIAARRAK